MKYEGTKLATVKFLILFNKGCLDKRYYSHTKDARWALLAQWKNKKLTAFAYIYKCKYCNGFHITSNKNAI